MPAKPTATTPDAPSVLPVFFDLETTNLNANYGRLICGAIKPHGQPAKIFRIDRTLAGWEHPWDDSELAEQIRDAIEGQYQIYGYNTVMFDKKYLDSRLLKHGSRPTRWPLHKDMMFVAKRALTLSSHALITVQEHFGLDVQKTRIDPETWNQAATGHATAIDYIAEHCERDVEVLEAVFNKLAPFISVVYK